MSGIVYNKDDVEEKKLHFYRQRTILRYSSTVIEEREGGRKKIVVE
jgi:hypothetical protein